MSNLARRPLRSRRTAIYFCVLAMLSLLPGCTMYQLRLGQFHLSGTVKAADTGKPIEGAQVRVVETTFIDAKRYKDLQEDIGQSGRDGRIDLDYRQKACRKAGPLRRMADALGREEPPGRLGVEISSDGYDPLRIYTTVDELAHNSDGRYAVNFGDISLSRASAQVSEKNRREQANCDK